MGQCCTSVGCGSQILLSGTIQEDMILVLRIKVNSGLFAEEESVYIIKYGLM